MTGDLSNQSPADNQSSPHQCLLCKKTFPRESTCKRHYYYCRSRRADTGSSRRRSCTACVRAKTRCIRLSGAGVDGACVRCTGRGAACDLSAAAASPSRAAAPDESSIVDTAGAAARPQQQPQQQQQQAPTDGALALSRYHGELRTFELVEEIERTARDLFADTTGPLGSLVDAGGVGGWDQLSLLSHNSVVDVDSSAAVDGLLGDESGVEYPEYREHRSCPDMRLTAAWNYLASYTPPFGRRAFPRPQQGPLAVLALQIICSYPSMMLQKATLPPFMSPVLYEWARSGSTLRLQPLVACFNIVYFFKTCSTSTRNAPWHVMKIEQENILAKYMQFDRWQLLASFQALLVYCILRVKDVPESHERLDGALLNTISAVFDAIVTSEGGLTKLKFPASPNLSWSDWIYYESLKRAILVFDILNILVRLTTNAYQYMTACRHILIPFTHNAAVWAAVDLETWESELKKANEFQTIYTVSPEGDLLKVKLGDTCLSTLPSRWEEWAAQVGEIGTLMMTIGALLKP